MRDFFGCYLLVSKAPQGNGRTYIGFTVNPRRRIRQHNGLIKAGAWKTSKWRPWEMTLVLYGFPTKIQALQFEWAWQHPLRSLIVRPIAQALGSKRLVGVRGKILLMLSMLHESPWRHFPLTLQYLRPEYAAMVKENIASAPPHVRVFTAPMDELPRSLNDMDDDEDGSGGEGDGEAERRDGGDGLGPGGASDRDGGAGGHDPDEGDGSGVLSGASDGDGEAEGEVRDGEPLELLGQPPQRTGGQEGSRARSDAAGGASQVGPAAAPVVNGGSTTASNARLRCQICAVIIQRHILVCSCCGVYFHLDCLAARWSSTEGAAGGAERDRFGGVPEQGHCPACGALHSWMAMLQGMQTIGWGNKPRGRRGRQGKKAAAAAAAKAPAPPSDPEFVLLDVGEEPGPTRKGGKRATKPKAAPAGRTTTRRQPEPEAPGAQQPCAEATAVTLKGRKQGAGASGTNARKGKVAAAAAAAEPPPVPEAAAAPEADAAGMGAALRSGLHSEPWVAVDGLSEAAGTAGQLATQVGARKPRAAKPRAPRRRAAAAAPELAGATQALEALDEMTVAAWEDQARSSDLLRGSDAWAGVAVLPSAAAESPSKRRRKGRLPLPTHAGPRPLEPSRPLDLGQPTCTPEPVTAPSFGAHSGGAGGQGPWTPDTDPEPRDASPVPLWRRLQTRAAAGAAATVTVTAARAAPKGKHQRPSPRERRDWAVEEGATTDTENDAGAVTGATGSADEGDMGGEREEERTRAATESPLHDEDLEDLLQAPCVDVCHAAGSGRKDMPPKGGGRPGRPPGPDAALHGLPWSPDAGGDESPLDGPHLDLVIIGTTSEGEEEGAEEEDGRHPDRDLDDDAVDIVSVDGDAAGQQDGTARGDGSPSGAAAGRGSDGGDDLLLTSPAAPSSHRTRDDCLPFGLPSPAHPGGAVHAAATGAGLFPPQYDAQAAACGRTGRVDATPVMPRSEGPLWPSQMETFISGSRDVYAREAAVPAPEGAGAESAYPSPASLSFSSPAACGPELGSGGGSGQVSGSAGGGVTQLMAQLRCGSTSTASPLGEEGRPQTGTEGPSRAVSSSSNAAAATGAAAAAPAGEAAEAGPVARFLGLQPLPLQPATAAMVAPPDVDEVVLCGAYAAARGGPFGESALAPASQAGRRPASQGTGFGGSSGGGGGGSVRGAIPQQPTVAAVVDLCSPLPLSKRLASRAAADGTTANAAAAAPTAGPHAMGKRLRSPKPPAAALTGTIGCGDFSQGAAGSCPEGASTRLMVHGEPPASGQDPAAWRPACGLRGSVVRQGEEFGGWSISPLHVRQRREHVKGVGEAHGHEGCAAGVAVGGDGGDGREKVHGQVRGCPGAEKAARLVGGGGGGRNVHEEQLSGSVEQRKGVQDQGHGTDSCHMASDDDDDVIILD